VPTARITLHDVARHAGVSQPTVSLVLGNHPTARVAAATRERVLAAARALGYRPNVVARSLVRGRSYALGVLVPDLANPFFLEVVAGAERVAAEAGYALLLCGEGTEPGRAAAHLDTLLGRQIDGVILDAANAAELADDAAAARALEGLNVVLVDQPPGRWPGVASDALAAGRLAAEHLLGLGHSRLAFVGPAADVHAFRQRERGFVQALRAAGVALPSAWLRRAPATAAGGMRAMRALLAERPRPTAVFCANDLAAVGALKACAAAGVRVPAELSLVGCDDVELASLVSPELTTVRVPARELGARAARLLVQRLAAPAPDAPGAPGAPGADDDGGPRRPRAAAPRPLPVRLVARGTTARVEAA
jgi:DNA-binding LacI/PurR family transcriptional regulator